MRGILTRRWSILMVGLYVGWSSGGAFADEYDFGERHKAAQERLEEAGAEVSLIRIPGMQSGSVHWYVHVCADIFYEGDEDTLEEMKNLEHLESVELGGARPVTSRTVAILEQLPDLEMLNVMGTKIAPSILQRLGRLKPLRHFSVSCPDATDDDLLALENIAQWRSFRFYAPKITDRGVTALRKARNLHAVSLSDSRITDKGMAVFAELPIRAIGLRNTRVTDAGLKYLAHCGDMGSLTLEGTNIRGPGLKHIAHMVDLHALDLQGTLIDDEGLKHLENLTAMRELCLKDTSVTDAGLVHLSELKWLTTLDLSNTKVTGSGLRHLREIPVLKPGYFGIYLEIDLSDCPVDDSALKQVAKVSKLTHLSLDRTLVTSAGIQHLTPLEHMRYLGLGDCQVDDAAVPSLRQMESLRFLAIRRTRISPAGVEAIQKALPDCYIFADAPAASGGLAN